MMEVYIYMYINAVLYKKARVAPNFIVSTIIQWDMQGHVWALVIKCSVSYSKYTRFWASIVKAPFFYFPSSEGSGGCDTVSGVAEI